MRQRDFKGGKSDVGGIYTLLAGALLVAATVQATYFKTAAAAKPGRTLEYLLSVFKHISSPSFPPRQQSEIRYFVWLKSNSMSDYPFSSCLKSLLSATSREQKMVTCQISCSPL